MWYEEPNNRGLHADNEIENKVKMAPCQKGFIYRNVQLRHVRCQMVDDRMSIMMIK